MLMLRAAIIFIGGSVMAAADDGDVLVAVCQSAVQQSMSSLAHGTMEFEEELNWTSGPQQLISGETEWDIEYYRCSLEHQQTSNGTADEYPILNERVEILKQRDGLLLRSQRRNDPDQPWPNMSVSIWSDGKHAKYNPRFMKDVRVLWFSESPVQFLPVTRYLEESTVIKKTGKRFRRTASHEGELIRVQLEFDGGWKKDIEFSTAVGGNIVAMRITEPAQKGNFQFSLHTYDWVTDPTGRWYPSLYESTTRSGSESGDVLFHHVVRVKSLTSRPTRDVPTSLTLSSLGTIPDGASLFEFTAGVKMPKRSVQGGELGGLQEPELRRLGQSLREGGFAEKSNQ